MQTVQQYNADQTRGLLDARDQALTDPETQLQLVQQMMDLQKSVRDRLAAIQADQADAMLTIQKNI